MTVSAVSGQTISGKVFSDTGKEPLPGVTIIADDTMGTSSDSLGNFTLNLQPGEHSVEFRLLSFKSDFRRFFLSAGENKVLNIMLQDDVLELGIVVISAGKFEQRLEEVTVSMEVLKPGIIEARNTTSMDEAVDNIPGVNVMDGQANIRGGSGWSYGAGSRVQVLVDDLPQLTADANDTKWNFLPVENLEQVEVIKGASSVLFGSSALNGVINIRTAYPRDTPLTRVNSFAGFYDDAFITTDKKYSLQYQDKSSFYGGLNFFHSRKINRLDFVAGGNYYNDNGYRQGENEKRGRVNVNTRYNFRTPGLAAGVNFNTMINNADIFFLWMNDTSGAYRPAANTLSESRTYRTNIDPFITYAGPGGSSHKLRSRWFNTTNENNTSQNSRGDVYYTEYQFQKKFNNSITITTGIVNNYSKVKSELYGDHTSNQLAGYLQGDFHWKRFVFSGGIRAEQNKVDQEKDDVTPVFRSGINYHAFDATYFRASIGQGYRFPSIAERFIQTSVGGVNIFPNPGLEAENGLSFEAGVKQGFQLGDWRGFIDGAVFENDYYDMIEFVFAQWANTPDFFQNLGFKSVNVGDTRIKGFEITLMAEGSLARNLSINLQAGYTYLDARQVNYDSTYILKIGPSNVMGSDSTDFLKYRYRHSMRANAEVRWKKNYFGVDMRYNSRMENIDRIFVSGFLDLAFPPGLGIADYRKYHDHGDLVFDTRIGRDVTDFLKISLVVKNVFNYIYMQRPADMQPPRSFALMLSARF